MQIVIFELGGEKYAIETSVVEGIDKVMDIALVPCAPKHIKGLINLRGSIITVIDPCEVLKICGSGKPQNIIIAQIDDETIGIVVDSIVGVTDVDENMVQNIFTSGEECRVLKGVIDMGGYLVTLVDADLLINV